MRFDDSRSFAGDKARRLDLAFEILRGKVGPRRRQAGIIHSVRPAA